MPKSRRAGIAAVAFFLALSSTRGQPRASPHGLATYPSHDATEKLDRHGDPLPPRAIARFGTTRLRHEGALAVAFSPDARILVSVAESELRLWDTSTGKEFPWLLQTGTSDRFLDIRFSRDSHELSTRLSNGQLQRWHVPTGKLLHEESRVTSPLDKPASRATLADQGVHAFVDRDMIRIERGAERVRPKIPAGHEREVVSLAASTDGRLLASIGADNRLIVWDVVRAEARHSWRGHDAICIAFSSDGKTLAVGEGKRGVDNSGGIRLWDVDKGRELRRLLVHGQAVFALAFSPDGKHLLSAGADNRARLWDATTWKEIRQFTPRKPRDPNQTVNPWVVAFSGDSSIAAICAGDDEEINLWPIRSAREPVRIPRHWLLGFRSDGKTLLAQNHFGHLSLREVTTGRELALSKSLAWLPSPDGRIILDRGAAKRDLTLRDWATGHSFLSYHGHRGEATIAHFAADGRSVFTASSLGTILQWEIPSVSHIRLERAWSLLMDASDREADKAINVFADVPKEAVLFLEERIRPTGSKNIPIARLIKDLDHDEFRRREGAMRQLERLGSLAEPELKAVLIKPLSTEFKKRAEDLLARVPVRLSTPEERASLRTATILERLGTPDAVEMLRRLADGYPTAALTREAQSALDRLAKSSNPSR